MRKVGFAIVLASLAALLAAAPARAADPPSPSKEAREFAATIIKATQILAEDHVKKVKQGEMVAWALDGLYRELDEPIPEELIGRRARVLKMKETDLIALLTDARQGLGNRPELADLRDVDLALAAIFSRLEPGTVQEPQRESRERPLCVLYDWYPTGIGIHLRKDRSTGALRVVTPIKDGPAYKADLRAGDLIVRITRETEAGGEPLLWPQRFATADLSLEQAEKLLHGKPGTAVKLAVVRAGESEAVEVKVARGKVEEETVFGRGRKADDSPDCLLDAERKIAYVRLTRFTKATAADLTRVVDDLACQGMQGLVLDLRFNPGGLLGSARDVADLFIDDGLIQSVRLRDGKEHRIEGKREGSYLNFPMACLVNGKCAGASEIVAACLQDHKRALIVGERTSGAVGVQSIVPLLNGAEMKFTSAVFCRPSGRTLARVMTSGKEDEDWGVVPDPGFALKLSGAEQNVLAEHLRGLEAIPHHDQKTKDAGPAFKDRQLDLALEYLRRRVKDQ